MTLSLIASRAVHETATCASALAAGDRDQLWLALASGGFGLLLILLVVSALREAMDMKRWPVAKGRIVSSTVEQYKEIAGAGKFGGTRTRMTLYRPAIAYEYEAAGQHFKGNRIAQSPGMNRGSPILPNKP